MAIVKLGAAITGSQSGATNTSVPIQSTTPSVNVGDFIVVGVGIKSAVAAPSSTTMQDGLGNSYASLDFATFGGGPPYLRAEIWAGFISNPGTLDLIAGWANAGGAIGQATRWSGVFGTTGQTAVDELLTNTGATTGMSVGPVTPQFPNELLVTWNIANGLQTFSGQLLNSVTPTYVEAASQTTGAANITGQMTETLLTGTPVAESYAATVGASSWGLVMATFQAIETFQPKRARSAYLAM